MIPLPPLHLNAVSKVSGGKAYFAKNWREEKQAFASIREDLVHLYTLSYYPQSNPNRGWRSIKVKPVGQVSAEVSYSHSRRIQTSAQSGKTTG